MAAAVVYSSELYKRGHGRPIYLPENEIHPGDVGFFRPADGWFCRLFNCTVPANHSVNIKLGVPKSFKPLELPYPQLNFTYMDDFLVAPQPIVSNSIVAPEVEVRVSGDPIINAGVGLTYKCRSEQGAVLLFGSRLARVDICDTKPLRNYAVEHVDSWYEFAEKYGFGPDQVPEGSIVLIRGCDKVPSYALAAFWGQRKEASVSFQGGFVKSSDIRVSLQGTWEHSDAAECRMGKSQMGAELSTIPTNADGDRAFPFFPSECVYTVFSRIWKIKRSFKILRLRIPTKMEAAAGPHQLPRGPDGDASTTCLARDGVDARPGDDFGAEVEISADWLHDLSSHPLDDIVDHILQSSQNIRVAIASDTDYYQLVDSNDSESLDVADLLARAQPTIEVDEGGVGQILSLKDIGSTESAVDINDRSSVRSILSLRGGIVVSDTVHFPTLYDPATGSTQDPSQNGSSIPGASANHDLIQSSATSHLSQSRRPYGTAGIWPAAKHHPSIYPAENQLPSPSLISSQSNSVTNPRYSYNGACSHIFVPVGVNSLGPIFMCQICRYVPSATMAPSFPVQGISSRNVSQALALSSHPYLPDGGMLSPETHVRPRSTFQSSPIGHAVFNFAPTLSHNPYFPHSILIPGVAASPEPFNSAITSPSYQSDRLVGTPGMRTAAENRRSIPTQFYCSRPDCLASFTRKHNLKIHEKSHEEQREHLCEHCKFPFTRAWDRDRHTSKSCRSRPRDGKDNGESKDGDGSQASGDM